MERKFKIINIKDFLSDSIGETRYEDGKYLLSSFLLAQFGKNYNLKPNERIDGDTLLQIAEEKMYEIKTEIGGVLIFLECEDSEEDVLLNFYLRNHYQVFGERQSAKNKKLYRLLKQI